MKQKLLFLLLICNLMMTSAFAQIRYVKPGGTGNGSSWVNASGSIQDMIDYTFAGGQVWIAGGTYLLDTTLQMKDNVNVYGGFFGDETSIADRPKSDLDGNGTIEPWEFTHATVLDGQHTRQVLNQAADFSIETVWDGVTIANGRVLGGVFGGGAYIRANCQLINSIIKNNVSASSNPNNALRAGGIYNKGGGIKKCIIYDNIIDDNQNYGASAGGVYNEEGTIDSCTIYNNSISHTHTYPSSYSGAGIYNKGGTVGNSIISNNKVIGGFIVHGVGIYNSDNGTINNCKIRENIVSDVVYSYGGGIYSHEGGTISNCEVISNFSALQGGGIFMNNGGVIENSTISGNTISVSQHAISFTPSGAGIYSDGAIIRNCTINENRLSYTYASANQSVCGGGLYIRGEGGAVSHCTVIGNTVSYSANTVNFARGGGIYCYETMTEIVDCIVKNNKTLINGDIDGQGGGVYQGVITRCRIEDNSSGEGGGFYKSSVNNCIVFNNSATSHGGGGFLEENGKSVNCTFINNTAAGRGGGIYVNASTNTSVANSVFWQNYAPFWEQIGTPAGASAANVTYSAVQEQYPGAGNIVIAEDNDNGGPLFFNPATHNWQLQEGSPCINAGSNVALSATDTIDLAGNPRVFDATVDMGAYERQGANPPTHTISGQVTCGGNPLEGVIITSDSSIVTDALGMYSMTVCQGTNIVITPTMEGYGFIPQSIACDNVMGNLENRNFTAITMIPVTHITNVPDTVLPNVPYLLNGTVEPSDATKQAIVWSVADAGTAGATIAGDTLNTAGIGTLVITATIIDGITLGVNYVQHFTIATALNFFCGGNGTPTDPYQICTHQQLNTLAVYVNAGNGDATEDKYYKLMSDIDLSSYDNWTPIGNNSTNNNTHRFQGYFDGNKKVVRNLTISDSSNYQGLFGYATGGAIQNLGIENCAINGNQYVGGLVGYSATDISNCYITGNVSGRGDYVGGLTGYGTSAISDCYATANVSGNAHVGGLMGFNSSTLSNSYAAGKINANDDYVGGLVGQNSNGTIRNCVAANDSIISALNVNNINRVCGNSSGNYQNNYALNIMIIKKEGSCHYFTNSNIAGTSRSSVTLRSLAFYATISNWHSDTTSWSIADSSGIWNICDQEGLPFLRWQNIDCDGPADDIFCGGNGTMEDPYQICNPQQLKYFADYINAGNGENTIDKYYKLMSDMDLADYDNWVPIGYSSLPFVGSSPLSFQGHFDGNEKVVRNLMITDSSDHCGLFGYINGATIQSLGIENCNIHGHNGVGVLVGRGNQSTISGCYATGHVEGTGNWIGGLVGTFSTNYAAINDCYTAVNVTGGNYVGGLAGTAQSHIDNCYTTGTVKGINYVGGVVGSYYNIGSMSNVVAANDSVIATNYTSYVNRICGNTNGVKENLYALDAMIVKSEDYIVTVQNNTAFSGQAKPLATLQSLSFYTTPNNWNSESPWSIVDPSGIWKICDSEGLPFLRWQGLTCDNAVLSGTVSIAGNAVYGEILTAVTSDLTSTPTVPLGTLSYQWKRNGINIGANSETYVLRETDINKTITVAVSAENCIGFVTSAATAAVAKALHSTPAQPTLNSSTTTSITLNLVSGCEYNINGGIWQSSPTFQGLIPNTSYTFTQRKKETATHLASLASEPAVFNTNSSFYTITASVNNLEFGIITPYGERQVETGGNITFNITPNSGYVIDNVLVNDTSQGAITTYTFLNVHSDGLITVIFKEKVGIAEIALSDILVYPNPTQDELRIISNKTRITGIEFFDVVGKKVFTPPVHHHSSEIVADISQLQAGVYFVRIFTEMGEVTKKVLKE